MNPPPGYHVGIILDGNGRFATAKRQPRLMGHRAGFKNVEPILQACLRHQITTVTVYAFAIANWKRDQDEVNGLWDIFRIFFDSEIKKIKDSKIRVKVIGRRQELAADIVALIEKAEAETAHFTKATFVVALNYDGVEEVARATKAIAAKVTAGELNSADITPELIESNLDTADLPPVDVIIRTGMPPNTSENGMTLWRSSSFLQLQSAQAVCVSTPVLWPAFTEADLVEAMALAKPDDRLFGGQRKDLSATLNNLVSSR